jgi:Flp pilus assembly protein TadG
MKRIWRWLGRYGRDRRGNISTMVALLIIPLAGVLGIATETGSWYVVQRAEQNAADSAVLAAAQNGIFGGTTYATEGRQVASNLGFTDGANFTTVTPVNAQPCPAPLSGSNCYKVTITRTVPVNLTRIIGYTGTGGTGRQTVIATAIAGPVTVAVSNCISSLGTGSDTYRVNGGPSVNLNGCVIQANGDMQCSGNNADGNVGYFFLAGSNNGCNPAIGGSPTLTDPYTTTYPSTNIPANTCQSTNTCADPTLATSYWQQSNNYGSSGNGNGNGNGNTVSLSPNTQPAQNNWTGGTKSPGVYRGDITVHNDTTMNPGTYVIENGSLIIDSGVTLSGSGVTIIFSGPTISGFSPNHLPPTSGTLDISAPDATSTSVWKGVAIYQDPSLTSGVDWTSNGSALNWNITGLIYMPNSDILFSGTINNATGGNDCFTLIDTTFRVNGNVTLTEQQTGCVAAGLSPPTSMLPRATLVQ